MEKAPPGDFGDQATLVGGHCLIHHVFRKLLRLLGRFGRGARPMNTQSGILCDPASLVLYGRCQARSRPHARFRKGESRRTLSEPFSPFESKPCIIYTCKEYPGAKLRSARCCSSRCAQKEDRKCNLRNLKSRSRLSKWSSAGASLESAVSSSNPLIVIRCANGIRSILDSLTKAKA